MAARGQRNVKAGGAHVELSTDDKTAKGLKKAQRRLRSFGASVTQIGARMAKVGVVMATAFVGSVKVFADFEKQLATVSTMLEDPAHWMPIFGKALRQMAIDFGESTETLAGGLYDILSASIPAANALDALAVAAKAAKAGVTDTKTAADAITTVLNAYGLSADHAADVSDLLFTIVKRGKTTFAELAPAIGMVASIGASAGINLDELGAMLATLTRNGVKTENAITATSSTIAAFLKPTAEATTYARELGFEMNSATLQAEGLHGVFSRISKLPPDAIARLFPNIRALRGVIPALRNVADFSSDIGIMANRAGATEAAYKKMSGTISHSFAQLKQQAIESVRAIGEALIEPVGKVLSSLKSVGQYVGDFIKRNKALVTGLATTAVALASVGLGMMAVGKAISVVSRLMAVAALATKALTVAFSVLAAHPVLAVLAAIAVAAKVVIGVVHSLTEETKEAAHNMQSLRRRGDEIRDTHLKTLAVLRKLEKVQKLNNDQMVEAEENVQYLTDRYDGLNLRLDKTTGKLTGVAQAQRRLNEVMTAAKLRELTNEAKEYEEEIERLHRVMRSAPGRHFGWSPERVGERLRELNTLRFDVMQLIEALRAGQMGALTAEPGAAAAAAAGGPKATAAAVAVESGKAASKLADLQRSLHRQRLDNIKDRYARERALIEERYDWEIKAGIKAGETALMTLTRIASQWEALRQVDRREQAAADQEKARAAKALADQRADYELELNRRIARAKINATMKGEERARALLKLEETEAIARARAIGADVTRVRWLFHLLAQKVKKGIRAPEVSVRGTFSAAGLRGLLGGGTAAEVTAENTGKIAKSTAQISRALANWTPAFQ